MIKIYFQIPRCKDKVDPLPDHTAFDLVGRAALSLQKLVFFVVKTKPKKQWTQELVCASFSGF
jgi:hypothetical protein